MAEQFDLSKKRTLSLGILNNKVYGYTEEDVKEFIRELKKEMFKKHHWKGDNGYVFFENDFYKILDKLAGKELIEDTQLNQTGGNTKNGKCRF